MMVEKSAVKNLPPTLYPIWPYFPPITLPCMSLSSHHFTLHVPVLPSLYPAFPVLPLSLPCMSLSSHHFTLHVPVLPTLYPVWPYFPPITLPCMSLSSHSLYPECPYPPSLPFSHTIMSVSTQHFSTTPFSHTTILFQFYHLYPSLP